MSTYANLYHRVRNFGGKSAKGNASVRSSADFPAFGFARSVEITKESHNNPNKISLPQKSGVPKGFYAYTKLILHV